MSGVLLGVAAVAISLLLSACTSARPILLPAVPHAYIMDCSGANLSWSHCYRKAGRACPHGYVVKQKPYKKHQRVVSGDFMQLLGNSPSHRRMLIACRIPGERGQATTPATNALPAGNG